MNTNENNIINHFKNYDNRSKIRFIYYNILFFLLIIVFATDVNVKEDKEYDNVNHIILYIYEFGDLPANYIHKDESRFVEGEELFLYGTFKNKEGLLPVGYEYSEAYVNATKEEVGAERLVFSTEHVYYTSDHYSSFELITKVEILSEHIIFIVLFALFILTYPVGILLLIMKYKVIEFSDVQGDINGDFLKMKIIVKKSFEYIKNKVKNNEI